MNPGQLLDGVPEAFIGPMLKDVVMHEVGHTLGLRHNFKASTVYNFVRHCFGDPVAVEATGATGPSGGIDHVSAVYRFESGPALVRAEGAWSSTP